MAEQSETEEVPPTDPLEDFDCYNVVGWDGYGGDPIVPATVAIARQVLSVLDAANLPNIAPGSDGTIGFEWHFTEGPMRKFIIDVWPNKVMARAAFANP